MKFHGLWHPDYLNKAPPGTSCSTQSSTIAGGSENPRCWSMHQSATPFALALAPCMAWIPQNRTTGQCTKHTQCTIAHNGIMDCQTAYYVLPLNSIQQVLPEQHGLQLLHHHAVLVCSGQPAPQAHHHPQLGHGCYALLTPGSCAQSSLAAAPSPPLQGLGNKGRAAGAMCFAAAASCCCCLLNPHAALCCYCCCSAH